MSKSAKKNMKKNDFSDKTFNSLAKIDDFWLKELETFVKTITKDTEHYSKLKVEKTFSFSEFDKLPLLKSATLKETPLDELRAADWKDIVGITRSSGTTGKSKNILWTKDAIDWDNQWGEVFFSKLGLKNTDRFLLMMPLELTRIGGWVHILNQIGVFCIPVGRIRNEVDADDAVTKAIELKPTVLCGSPNRIFTFTQDIIEKGLDPKTDFKVNKIVTGGSILSKSMRTSLEKAWGTEVFDICGANEVSFMGFECKEHNGMHFLPGPNYIEVVDENNQRITDGSEGKIAITNYRNFGTPILRYEVGDRGRISYEKCNCGLIYPRLFIGGRETGSIILGGTKLHAADIEEVISGFDFLTNAYQVIVENKQKATVINFYIETIDKKEKVDPTLQNEIKEKLTKASYSIYDKVLNGEVIFNVTLVDKNTLKRSVTDKIKNQFQDLRS